MSPTVLNPFLHETRRPWIALPGARNGYIQLATSHEVTRYEELPSGLFEVARAWAAQLEKLGAQRVYWIILSEVVPHLHIHLYPRWAEDTEKGLALFEQREHPPQPVWTDPVKQALTRWQQEYDVWIVETHPE